MYKIHLQCAVMQHSGCMPSLRCEGCDVSDITQVIGTYGKVIYKGKTLPS